MFTMSDGLKTRVVFCMLSLRHPHILLLDEPTNHLDMDCIMSLADAINRFEGGLVLVSHDFRLLNEVAKEIWVCDDKTITVSFLCVIYFCPLLFDLLFPFIFCL